MPVHIVLFSLDAALGLGGCPNFRGLRVCGEGFDIGVQGVRDCTVVVIAYCVQVLENSRVRTPETKPQVSLWARGLLMAITCCSDGGAFQRVLVQIVSMYSVLNSYPWDNADRTLGCKLPSGMT
jgi:hypothetical protein